MESGDAPPLPPPVYLVVSGPAGGGKTTLCAALVEAFGPGRPPAGLRPLRRVVTTTTRAPRQGERDGVDYHFLDRPGFLRRKAAGAFLEWAEVYEHLYGTGRDEVQAGFAGGFNLIQSIDVQGAASLRTLARRDALLRGRLLSVFVSPATVEELQRRLVARAQNDPDDLARRLEEAEKEMAQAGHFDLHLVSRSREEDFAAMEAFYRSRAAGETGGGASRSAGTQ